MTLDKQLARVAIALCDGVDSPVSRRISMKIKSGDIRSVVSEKISPHDYSSSESYLADTAVVDFLRKIDVDVGIDRRQIALDNFWVAERSCCQTNEFFDRAMSNGPFEPFDMKVLDFLEPARAWISRVLGPIPRDLDVCFGPGATYHNRGLLTTLADKIETRPTATSRVSPYLSFFERSAWGRVHWQSSTGCLPSYIRGNRFTTVPKDARKDRGICVEPSLNVSYQLSVGKHLKRRLALHQLNLADGWKDHRDFAASASLNGSHATIDLSMASDTVSYKFVKYMLPPDWFSLLDDLRSPTTLVDGKLVHLQKFSSMGNGYTFELETLLFASLCIACGAVGGDFLVFGDDIIIRSELANLLVLLLQRCGFSINSEKSFLSGPFRESCGGDFFSGKPVRAYFCKKNPLGPEDWIKICNGIRRCSLQSASSFRYSFGFKAWLLALAQIPSSIRRLRGPDSLGDLVINDDSHPFKVVNGLRYYKVYRPVSNVLPWHHWKRDVVLASVLKARNCERGLTPRSSVSGYKIDYVVCPD